MCALCLPTKEEIKGIVNSCIIVVVYSITLLKKVFKCSQSDYRIECPIPGPFSPGYEGKISPWVRRW